MIWPSSRARLILPRGKRVVPVSWQGRNGWISASINKLRLATSAAHMLFWAIERVPSNPKGIEGSLVRIHTSLDKLVRAAHSSGLLDAHCEGITSCSLPGLAAVGSSVVNNDLALWIPSDGLIPATSPSSFQWLVLRSRATS
jgi:hypothetical protein